MSNIIITKNTSSHINQLILQASSLMTNSDFDDALSLIHDGLILDNNNYELIFMNALCEEQLGHTEDSYYLYKLALFIVTDDNDKLTIQNEFTRMCSYYDADSYRLGKALENLIIQRIKIHEYSVTYEFLKTFIYDTNRFSALINLTEENMLLYIMLEIWHSEQSHDTITADSSSITHLFVCHDAGLNTFHNIYYEVKHALRRIWFGMAQQYQMKICELISRYNLSPDALLILARYSIEESFWYDAFNRISSIIRNNFPVHADFLDLHSKWLHDNNIDCDNNCYPMCNYSNNADITYLNYSSDTPINPDEYSRILSHNLDYSKISIIFCTNDMMYCNECILYLKQLIIPDNMSLDIIVVKGAPSMAAGYNYAMLRSDAGYKLYIHHDTFIIDRDILNKLISVFRNDSVIGMIGNTGTTHLTNTAKWFTSDIKQRRGNLYHDKPLNVQQFESLYKHADYEYAEAIDGIFISTSYDILWREDIFDNWHYYDISQTYEFRYAGLQTVFINMPPITLLHETTATKDYNNYYDKYCNIFKQHYLKI